MNLQTGRYWRRMNYAAADMPLGKALYIRKTPGRFFENCDKIWQFKG